MRIPVIIETPSGETTDYIADLETELYLPRQSDKGCVSAVGAFVTNRLVGKEIATPSDIDEVIGRKDGEYGSTPNLAQWYLRQGYKVEKVCPESPLDEPFRAMASGQITMDEYWEHFQAHFGTFEPARQPIYEKYYRNVVLPAFYEDEALLAQHAKSGQYTKMMSELTPKVLANCVAEDKHIVADTASKKDGTTHKVSIFRPNVDHPALLFWPRQFSDSTLSALTPELFEGIVSLQEEILVISKFKS